jgi:nucleoside-diphosphate-sugar epimerase
MEDYLMNDNWVAITGASGFVGKYIATALREKGYKVMSLSRTTPDVPVDRHISVDISDGLAMAKITADMPHVQCAVHVAASKKQDESAITANVLGTYNVLKFLGQHARSICNISGVTIIGAPESPIITEQHIVKPQNLYHLTKYQAELLCDLPEFQGLNISTLRFASPIGPGMPKGLIVSAFVSNSLANNTLSINGKGERVMNYIDVRDIADAVIRAVERPNVSGLFLLNGTSISNLDLARLCISVTNSKSAIEFSGNDDSQDAHKWIIDGTKAATQLGFTARITLDQSLADIAESLR